MKKLTIGALLALLVFGLIGGAVLAAGNTQGTASTAAPWANPTDKQKSELTELQSQILTVREKMIDKYLEYKWISLEQAEYMKDRLALHKKYAGKFGQGFGAGYGCGVRGGFGGRGGGRGFGMMGGYGPGFGMMGGYGPGYGMMGGWGGDPVETPAQ